MFSLVNKASMMPSKYSIKRLEQQKANVLEVQATMDHKIQEAEEHNTRWKLRRLQKGKQRKRKEGQVIIKATGKG